MTIPVFLPTRSKGDDDAGGRRGQQGEHHPAARVCGFKNHLSHLPHSGSVFPQLKDEIKGYATSPGALRFDIGRPLPAPLVEKLITVRLRQAFPD